MKARYLLLFLILVIISCKKETIVIIDPLDIDNKPSEYFPMEVGNFWVYESYKVSDNQEEFLRFDTVSIIKDTIVGADKFYFFEKSSASSLISFSEVLGVKNHHIVDENGITFLSSIHNDTLALSQFGGGNLSLLTWINTEYEMPEIRVPLGNFNSNEVEMIDKVIEVNFSNEPVSPNNPRRFHNYFVKNIGMIWSETAFVSNTDILFVSKLKEYHLN
jgi:hypothetical protein